jgi:hypothetical protein
VQINYHYKSIIEPFSPCLRFSLKTRIPGHRTTRPCSSKIASALIEMFHHYVETEMLILNNCIICSYEEVLKPQGFVIASIEDNDVAVEPRKVCLYACTKRACRFPLTHINHHYFWTTNFLASVCIVTGCKKTLLIICSKYILLYISVDYQAISGGNV